MNEKTKHLLIRIFSLAGLIVAIKLCLIYYSVNFDEYALPSFCSVNNFIDCDGVAKTKFSQFLGIPLSYWGLFLYLTILFLSFKENIKSFLNEHDIECSVLDVFKVPISYISVLSSAAFVCSIILALISLKIINKVCVLCFVTYIIDLVIAAVASNGFKTVWKDIVTTFKDFISGVKIFPKTFVVILILATGFLTYTTLTLQFAPIVKKTKSIMKYKNIKVNPYKVSGNVLGNPKGNVKIELYSDFVCPLCYINNIMLHQAVSEYSNVYVIHHNYPFDTECNIYVSTNMHPGACYMSRAAIAAEKQGNYWGMGSLLYEKQPKTEKELLNLADELGFNKEKFIKDMNSDETERLISTELKNGDNINIDATPTMIINGKKYVGVKPYYELVKILEEHGAVKK